MTLRPLLLVTIACALGGAGALAQDAGPTGRWLAQDIRGAGVIDRAQSMIEIAADGRVSGSGGCNRMGGQARIDGARIAFGALFATKMACPPAVMDQEGKFFAALNDARGWRIDAARNMLFLLDESGKAIVTLSAM